jgi:L-rhamnose mutarotase
MRQNHSAYKEANVITYSLSLNESGYLLFAVFEVEAKKRGTLEVF